ncbi:hypothetical protein IJT93_01925 [bacterium]|nr:hypothetical protein [bacterium]
MHTKFSILFAVISVLFLLAAQARFIASDRVSEVAPLSHADLDIKLQGRRDKHHIQANVSKDNLINNSNGDLQDRPAPGSKRTVNTSYTGENNENVGNLAVGFGENAPENITERHPVHNRPAQDRRDDDLASGSTQKAAVPKDKIAKAEINFVKNHPKFNKAEPGQNFSASDIPIGLSEEQMKLRKKKPTVFIRNPYERSLKQVYLLTEQSGDLALTKAQAKKILYYVNCIENAKDSEDKAYREIKKILTPQQQQTINVYLSGRMKHDSGPKLEETDPLAAALKAIEN